MALRPFSCSKNISVFSVKIKSTETPDDISKVYFGISLDWFFDPHPYSPTALSKIGFAHPCGGVRVWLEKSVERYSEINFWNIIRDLRSLDSNTKNRKIFWARKWSYQYLFFDRLFRCFRGHSCICCEKNSKCRNDLREVHHSRFSRSRSTNKKRPKCASLLTSIVSCT